MTKERCSVSTEPAKNIVCLPATVVLKLKLNSTIIYLIAIPILPRKPGQKLSKSYYAALDLIAMLDLTNETEERAVFQVILERCARQSL